MWHFGSLECRNYKGSIKKKKSKDRLHHSKQEIRTQKGFSFQTGRKSQILETLQRKSYNKEDMHVFFIC